MGQNRFWLWVFIKYSLTLLKFKKKQELTRSSFAYSHSSWDLMGPSSSWNNLSTTKVTKITQVNLLSFLCFSFLKLTWDTRFYQLCRFNSRRENSKRNNETVSLFRRKILEHQHMYTFLFFCMICSVANLVHWTKHFLETYIHVYRNAWTHTCAYVIICVILRWITLVYKD